MIQARSMTIEAMKKRIQRLPDLVGNRLESYAKKNATALVSLFHDGIRDDKLGLWPLKDRTIATKEAAGFEFPDSPLYGLGDEDKEHTYSNMMEVSREGNAFIVKPKKGYHWSKSKKHRIKLSDLFIVHEYGTTISNGFGKGIVIRIPPRPAFTYAYMQLMAKLRKEEPAKKVREAMVRHAIDAEDFAKARVLERMGGYP